MLIPDVVVAGPSGDAVLVAEVKNVPELSEDEALGYRANLYNQWSFSRVPFFLLVSQDRGYLWAADGPGESPVASFPMDDVFHAYLGNSRSDHVRGAVLETVLARWLTDITFGATRTPSRAESALAEVGAREALAGGHVVSEDAIAATWSSTSSQTSS